MQSRRISLPAAMWLWTQKSQSAPRQSNARHRMRAVQGQHPRHQHREQTRWNAEVKFLHTAPDKAGTHNTNAQRNQSIGTRTPLGGGLTQAVRPLESVFHNSGFARVCDLWSVVGGPELNGRTVGHGEKGCQNRPPATANTDRWTCIRAGCTRSGRDAEDRCWQPRPRRTMTR